MSVAGHTQAVGGESPAIMIIRLREQVSAAWFAEGADRAGAMDLLQEPACYRAFRITEVLPSKFQRRNQCRFPPTWEVK